MWNILLESGGCNIAHWLEGIGWSERLLLLPLSYHAILIVVAILENRPGKMVYWLGASILTLGLFFQRG